MDASAPPPPNHRPSAEEVRARKSEIAKEYKRKDKARNRRRPKDFPTRRLEEIERLYRDRWGQELPDDDAGADDLRILVDHVIAAGKDPWPYIKRWASWCPSAEGERLVWSANCYPVRYTADELGARFNLHYETHRRLDIRTIGCVDATKAERKRFNDLRRNGRKRDKSAAEKQAYVSQTKAPKALKPREVAVFELVNDLGVTTPALIEQLKRLKAFHGVAPESLRIVVHRVLDRLLSMNLISESYIDGPKGRIRCVRRRP